MRGFEKSSKGILRIQLPQDYDFPNVKNLLVRNILSNLYKLTKLDD